jgi:hypothetical protein
MTCDDATVTDVRLVDELDLPDDLLDAPPTEPETESEPTVDAAPRFFSPMAMIATGLFVAVIRWWFSLNRTIFHVAPDEAATFAMSRWIGGGTDWSMFDHATWRPGLPTLIAPIYWFTDDATTVFHGSMVILAVVAGISAMVLARLGLRLTTMSPTACLIASAAIGVSASSLSATAFAWAEALVTLSFLATLWFMLEFYEHRRLTSACASIAWAVVGFTSHSRLMPLVGLATALVVANTLWNREWKRTAQVAGFAAAVTGIATGYTKLVWYHVWDEPGSSNSIGTIWRRLDNPIALLESLLGQVWYQMVATAALSGVGILVVGRRSLRRGRPAIDARLVAALTVPLCLVSVVFMSARTRSDHRIYGRYNDAILWPVLIIAIGWLVGLARQPATRSRAPWLVMTLCAATLVGTGIGVYYVDGAALNEAVGVRPMIAGLVPYIGGGRSLEMVYLTGAALALFAVALLVCRWPGPRSVGLCLVLVAVMVGGGIRTHRGLSLRLNTWGKAIDVRTVETAGILPKGVTVGFKFVKESEHPTVNWDDQRRRAQLYQFYLPDYEFVRDRGVDDSVGPYVFAPTKDKDLIAAGAKLLWTEPGIPMGLWLEPITP